MAKGYKTGGGLRKGVPNKATKDAREAIARFVDGNTHRLQGWLDSIADGVKHKVLRDGNLIEEWLIEPNPEKAFALMQSVLEYHVPKLARTEVTGKEGGPIDTVWTVKIVDPKKPGA